MMMIETDATASITSARLHRRASCLAEEPPVALRPQLFALRYRMADYLTLSDLEGSIPPQFLIQALDDDNDQVIDAAAWAKVLADAQGEVDSYLEGKMPLPLTITPVPMLIKQAAKAFVCELLYRRRATPDETNPWKKQADGLRKRLAAIQAGEVKMSAAPNSDAFMPDAAATVILEDSSLGRPGRVLA